MPSGLRKPKNLLRWTQVLRCLPSKCKNISSTLFSKSWMGLMVDQHIKNQLLYRNSREIQFVSQMNSAPGHSAAVTGCALSYAP